MSCGSWAFAPERQQVVVMWNTKRDMDKVESRHDQKRDTKLDYITPSYKMEDKLSYYTWIKTTRFIIPSTTYVHTTVPYWSIMNSPYLVLHLTTRSQADHEFVVYSPVLYIIQQQDHNSTDFWDSPWWLINPLINWHD